MNEIRLAVVGLFLVSVSASVCWVQEIGVLRNAFVQDVTGLYPQPDLNGIRSSDFGMVMPAVVSGRRSLYFSSSASEPITAILSEGDPVLEGSMLSSARNLVSRSGAYFTTVCASGQTSATCQLWRYVPETRRVERLLAVGEGVTVSVSGRDAPGRVVVVDYPRPAIDGRAMYAWAAVEIQGQRTAGIFEIVLGGQVKRLRHIASPSRAGTPPASCPDCGNIDFSVAHDGQIYYYQEDGTASGFWQMVKSVNPATGAERILFDGRVGLVVGSTNLRICCASIVTDWSTQTPYFSAWLDLRRQEFIFNEGDPIVLDEQARVRPVSSGFFPTFNGALVTAMYSIGQAPPQPGSLLHSGVAVRDPFTSRMVKIVGTGDAVLGRGVGSVNPARSSDSRSFDVVIVPSFRVMRFHPVLISSVESTSTATTIAGVNLNFAGAQTEVLVDSAPQAIRETTADRLVIDRPRAGGRLSIRLTHPSGVVTSLNTAILSSAINPPEYTRDGLVSVFFSGQADQSCREAAPGAVMTLYGGNLSTATAATSSSTWPSVLGNTRLLLNGNPMPLHLVSPGQINFQISYDVAGTARMRVESEGGVGPEIELQIRETAPCFLFTAGQPYSTSVGSVQIMYATGLGVTDPPVMAGHPAPASPLARAVRLPAVMIGGKAAAIDFAGLVPGFVGLYQVNARGEE